MLETPSISEYFDTLMYQGENLWSADNQQATHLSLVASCEEENMTVYDMERLIRVFDTMQKRIDKLGLAENHPEQFVGIRREIRQSRKRVEEEIESSLRFARQESDRRMVMRRGRA